MMEAEDTKFTDKALGDAIQTQAERVEQAKQKKSSLQRLYEQLEAVAEDGIVITSKSTDKVIRITVKTERLTEELEILMSMNRIHGEITHKDSENKFIADLEYMYA